MPPTRLSFGIEPPANTAKQFQVNHRPGKRLIRAINLLQEELQALMQINSWQQELIQRYSCVLDDKTYEIDLPARRAMYRHEGMLLQSCAEQLQSSAREMNNLIRRCGPLSDSTKQSLEINEEDHGKAIMVFTVVTIIFLPLSFVTSFFGMNTIDIRDMSSSQSLFWAVAIPLTAVTMSSALFIAYNGDDMRDLVVRLYNFASGKGDSSTAARGRGTALKNGAMQAQSDSSSLSDVTPADNAEYSLPEFMTNHDFSFPGGRRIYYDDTRPSPYVDEFDLPTSRLHAPPPPRRYNDRVYVDERFHPTRRYNDPAHPSAIVYEDDEWDYTKPRYNQQYPRSSNPFLQPYNDRHQVQEYTWHKKSKHRRAPNVRIYNVDRGGDVPGYGVEERRL